MQPWHPQIARGQQTGEVMKERPRLVSVTGHHQEYRGHEPVMTGVIALQTACAVVDRLVKEILCDYFILTLQKIIVLNKYCTYNKAIPKISHAKTCVK